MKKASFRRPALSKNASTFTINRSQYNTAHAGAIKLIQLNPLQNTANTFQAVTGITLKPEQIDLLLRLHRASSFWTRANKSDPAENNTPTLGRAEIEIKSSGSIEFKSGGSVNLEAASISNTLKETKVGTVEQPASAAQVKPGQHSYISSDFTPDPYYPWQIVVIDRLKNSANSYAVNFSNRPSIDEFAEHYIRFENRTHWVHINDFTSGKKVVVSEQFWKALSDQRNNPKAGPVQEAQAGVVSAEGKAFKLTYFTGPGTTADKFYDTEPTAWVISYYSNAYGKATVTAMGDSK